MKPYYEHAGITIYHGNCMEILPTLERVDLIISDPPYGVNKAGWDGYLPMDWMFEAARLTDVLAIMPGVSNLAKVPARIAHLEYQWTLAAYISNGMTRGAFGFGNWIPCMVFGIAGASLHCNSQDFFHCTIGGYKPDHPSPKPQAVMRWLIGRFSGTSILDPFMGSGTTLFAAKELNRKGVGIDINERYCEIAAKRLSQEVLCFEEAIR